MNKLRSIWQSSPYLVFLVGQLLIFLLCNICWVYRSFFCLQFDSLEHAMICLEYFDGSSSEFPYPRFVHLLTVPWLWALGLSKWPFFLVESAFSALWVIATYLLGREMFSERTGFWAATLLLWTAQLTVSVRTYLLDYPVAALLTLQLYLFLRSRGFTRKWPSLLFLFLIPVITGTKYQYVLSAAPILVALSLHLFWKERSAGGYWGALSIAAQPLVPLACTALGLCCGLEMNGGAIVFCAAMAATSFIQLRLWQRQGGSSPFLHYQIGVALAVIFTVWFHTQVFIHGTLGYYFTQNICLPHLPSPTLGGRLALLAEWVLGYLIETKTKNVQAIPFLLYSIGLGVILCRPKLMKGYAFLAITTVLTSLFFVTFTYNAVRFQAPILSLRCLIAVFWIEYLGEGLQLWLRRAALGVIVLFAATGLCFNGGWMVSSTIPRSDVNILLNDLIFANGVDGYFYHFEWPYDPQRSFDYTLSRAEHPERLFNSYSVWSPGLWCTCEPYDIDWGTCASGMLNAMERREDIAFIEVRPANFHNRIFCSDDDPVGNLNTCYRFTDQGLEMPTLPLWRYADKNPRYLAIAGDPTILKETDWHCEGGRLIYRWNAPGVEIRLFDRGGTTPTNLRSF